MLLDPFSLTQLEKNAKDMQKSTYLEMRQTIGRNISILNSQRFD